MTSKPSWLERGQLRWAWLAWEPLRMLRRHGGVFEAMQANAHWSADWFERIHGEDYLRMLRDAGFNCVTTHFHKGFGPETESDEMAMCRKLIEVCHRLDMRVLAYVQSMSFMYETTAKEMPEAAQWVQIDETGRPRPYAEQYWRHLLCLSHDAYVAFVEQMARQAISWAGADGVWLDNTNFMACQCSGCRQKFSEYLKQHHPRPDESRFGIASFDDVQVPVVGRTYDPVYQEAIRFRCETLTCFAQRIRSAVRSENSEAAVAANFGAPCPYNAADVLGVDHAATSRAVDIVLAENGNFPHVDGDEVVTQALAFKAGRANNAVVIPSHWLLKPEEEHAVTMLPGHVEQIKLTLAESAALGWRCVGSTWAARAVDMGRKTLVERADIQAAVRAYQAFFAEHESLYQRADSLAVVATYRNFSSCAFAHEQIESCVQGFEQALLLNHVPYDVLFEQNLIGDDLARRYAVLVLANVVCMSDEEIDQVRAFVRGGGGLLATGDTSLYDENLRQRRDYGLSDLFGVSAGDDMDRHAVYRNGRVTFMPQCLERVSFNHKSYQLRPQLPPKHIELIDAVNALCPDGQPVAISTDAPVAVEIARVNGSRVVHMLNYDNSKPVRDFDVHIAGSANNVQLLSPDSPQESKRLDMRTDDRKGFTMRVECLQTYSMLLVS